MCVDVVLPKWGLTMEEAVVVAVLCAVGDTVKKGVGICEVESDKAINDLVAPVDGVLEEWLVAVGDEIAVGTVVARIRTLE